MSKAATNDQPGGKALRLSNDMLRELSTDVPFPTYDRTALTAGIVHLGVGGFHRSHEALYIHELLQDHGIRDWAICGVGIMPQDAAMSADLRGQDCLYTLVEQSGDEDQARIIGSIVDHIFGLERPEEVFSRLADPATRIVSLTVTEGGYFIDEASGELDLRHSAVLGDLECRETPKTIYGFLIEGLRRRRDRGAKPFTVLCCDNIQHNGDVVRKMLLTFCEKQDPELAEWIGQHVSFPNSMVDRITPVSGEAERILVREKFGLEDKRPVVSEAFRQWVIEDTFCNGRPPLEKVGVQFTDDVIPYERMKILLLNATHSAMGYLGYLAGYRYIHEVASAPEFRPYLRTFMDKEMTPLVGEVPGIDLAWYKDSLIERFSNPEIKDTVLRICFGGSFKMPKFIFPAIMQQLERGGPIYALTLSVASWLRFLSGEDEQGVAIPIEDPLAERLKIAAAGGREPAAFVSDMSDLFGRLGEQPRFLAELERLSDILRRQGARGTLANFQPD